MTEDRTMEDDEVRTDHAGHGTRDDGGYSIKRLGAMIKERRKGRFTVEELASRSSVSSGLVSQIERGIGNPSFSTLARLAKALDLPLGEMFEGPPLDERQMVVRRDERRRMVVPSDGAELELLVPGPPGKLGLISTVLPSGFVPDEVGNTHPGDEVVLVLSGILHAKVGGNEFVLEEGDTLSYDSSYPHHWSNPGDEPVEFLAISTPPAAGMTHSG